METLFFFLYIPLFLALYLITSHFLHKFRKCPPTPFSLPIIGHLYVFKEPMNRTFANLANRYGPVLSLRFGSRPVLMVSSPSATEECLTKNDVVFCNRPSRFLVGKYLGYDYTSLTWAPYGPHWRNLRRILVVELLSNHRLQLLGGIRVDEVKLLVKRLQMKAAAGGGGVGHVLGMKPLLMDLAMNIMTRMIFGKRYYDDDVAMDEAAVEAERFRGTVSGTFRLFNEVCIGDMIPYLRWLDWRKERRFRKFKEQREGLMGELIDAHRRKVKEGGDGDNGDQGKEKPLIQVLLGLQESDPEYYKDEIILGIVLDLLIAGSDSSARTIEWALSLLLNHPKELKKAQLKIDSLVGNERLLSESDLNHLPYLRCIINETLRMYPAAPNLVPHESSEDCVVGGYHIPRGTMLQVNLWAIQNDPKIWDEPEYFKPERFEGVDGHKIGYQMMPFGAGRRSCPGEGLAIRVVGLTIGSLIQCFEWERIDGNKLVDMSKAPGFNMQKAEPLQARIRTRPSMIKLLSQLP